MSDTPGPSEPVFALVLVGIAVVAVPTGLTLAGAMSAPTTTAYTTSTPLPIPNLTDTPTATPTPTPTPTATGNATPTATGNATPTATGNATPTATPGDGGGGGDGGGDGGDQGRELVVASTSGVAGATESDPCDNAEYTRIQRAVDAAEAGDTVRVCEDRYPESVTVDRQNVTLVADGDTVIDNVGEPAVRITAPGVTIRGFDVRADEGVGTGIVVGSEGVLVENNTVNATDVGIVLGDGTAEGYVSTAGAATDGRVLGNDVTAANYSILSSGDAAVIGANSVTVRSRLTDANGTGIVIGGQDTVVRDNTVDSVDRGVFLDDGRSSPDEPLPDPGAATGSRVANNTVRAVNERIWTDADRTVVRDNDASVYGQCDTSSPYPPDRCDSSTIVSSGNETVVRNNTVSYPLRGDSCPPCEWAAVPAGIKIGTPPQAGPDSAHDNLVVGNAVTGPRYGNGISIVRVATGTVVRNNTAAEAEAGVIVVGNGTGRTVIGNTLSGGEASMHVRGPVTIRNNSIQGRGEGVYVEAPGPFPVTILDNRIVGNALNGISIDSKVAPGDNVTIHRNEIRNNGQLGIFVENYYKTDGNWSVVNATRNYWGCGGPSTGLADPYTERRATGSGDEISAADEPGVSNVHFDPFLQRSVCPGQSSTPTPTPTSTRTPTPSPTPTPPGVDDGSTPGSEGEATDSGDGAGASDGAGDGGGDESGTGGGEQGDSDTSGSDGGDPATPPPESSPTPAGTPTATPPPTPTPTPSVSPTPTVSPTPAVEPGFGVVTWLVGVILLVGLIAARRRVGPNRGDGRD